jgi:hypothetical protein
MAAQSKRRDALFTVRVDPLSAPRNVDAISAAQGVTRLDGPSRSITAWTATRSRSTAASRAGRVSGEVPRDRCHSFNKLFYLRVCVHAQSVLTDDGGVLGEAEL